MNDGLMDLTLSSSDRPADRGFAQASATMDFEISLRNNVESWVIEAVKKLDSLARRQRNWDSYDGLPLHDDAKNATVKVLQWLKTQRLPVPLVILGSAGTVHMEWRAKGKELEVEMGEGANVEFVQVLPDGDLQEGKLSVCLPLKLRELTTWLLAK